MLVLFYISLLIHNNEISCYYFSSWRT